MTLEEALRVIMGKYNKYHELYFDQTSFLNNNEFFLQKKQLNETSIKDGCCVGLCVALSKFIKSEAFFEPVEFIRLVLNNYSRYDVPQTDSFFKLKSKKLIDLVCFYQLMAEDNTLRYDTDGNNNYSDFILEKSKFYYGVDASNFGYYRSLKEKEKRPIVRWGTEEQNLDIKNHNFANWLITDTSYEKSFNLNRLFFNTEKYNWKLTDISTEFARKDYDIQYKPDYDKFTKSLVKVIEKNLANSNNEKFFMSYKNSVHEMALFYMKKNSQTIIYFFEPNMGFFKFNELNYYFVQFLEDISKLYSQLERQEALMNEMFYANTAFYNFELVENRRV